MSEFLNPADDEAQRKKEQDEWIALHERLNERRIKSGIPPAEDTTFPKAGEPQNANSRENISLPTNPPTVWERGASRSRFVSLTEETIRETTQRGETPLHRAAKLGKISEIPRHLLTIELFMTKTNPLGGYTPLHLAAEHGHLDQVPKEFLTKEAMTVSGSYSTGSGYLARTETPLHVAARCGNADQIPKEFLTPEFLSIEAGGIATTVLHELAYADRFDLIPSIHANSPMWNLRDRQGRTPRDILGVKAKQDAYVARVRERQNWRPPRLTLPIQHEPSKLLPVFTDESLREIKIKATTSNQTYIVNLLDYTCTNPLCLEIHSEVPSRDFGRLCKHIITALRQNNLVAQLPPIARGIAENGRPFDAYGVYPGRFAQDLYGRSIYITGKNYDGWINIFAILRRNGVNYSRFGYNVTSRRWYAKSLMYVHLPKIDDSILH